MYRNMRKRLFEIIEKSNGNDNLSSIYDSFMLIVILLSLVPLAFKSSANGFALIDKISVSIFIIDYILRFITADFRYQDKSIKSFIKYPFSFMALMDLFAILPSFTVLNQGFKVLKLFRMIRALRVFRAFKALRYSKSIEIITNVLRESKDSLMAVGTLAIAYILISALIIFNVEPDSFNNFFDAIYWATVSLTTVGYGDIYPVTTIGKMVSMVSSFFGIAVVALPSGIITAGYLDELNKDNKN